MATYNPIPLIRRIKKLSRRKKKKLMNRILGSEKLTETAMNGAYSMGNTQLAIWLHNHNVDRRRNTTK